MIHIHAHIGIHMIHTYIYIHMINYTCIKHTVYPWHSHRYMYMLYIYIIASVPRHPMPCTSQPPGPDPRVCRDKLTNVRCWYNLIQPLKEGYLILLTNILVYHGISWYIFRSSKFISTVLFSISLKPRYPRAMTSGPWPGSQGWLLEAATRWKINENSLGNLEIRGKVSQST